MKYYILFGPPGAGKGTHAGAIAQKYNLKHLSTGELLRAEIAAGTPLGLQAKDLIAAGSLVPDEVVEGMIENAFESIKGVDGFLLDGFILVEFFAQQLIQVIGDLAHRFPLDIGVTALLFEEFDERLDADVEVFRYLT